MAKAKAQTRLKPYRARRFGIKNHRDEVWTSETFQTAEKAQRYLDQQRPLYGGLTRKHAVASVRVTISLVK